MYKDADFDRIRKSPEQEVWSFIARKQYAKANVEFKKALSLDPNKDSAYFRLGFSAFFHLGSEPQVRYNQRAVLLNPNYT